MEIIVILLLFGVSVILLSVEFFLIPGTSFAGIGACCCLVLANCVVFGRYGFVIGLWTLAVTLIAGAVLGYWIVHSKAMEKYYLHKSIDSTAAPEEQLSVRVGDEGVAVTRLALIGNAEINGKTVEVKSADGFLDEGTLVVVVRVDEAQITVKRR